jgi:hypothetical protein
MTRSKDEHERDQREQAARKPERTPERTHEPEREKRPDAALGRKPASFSGNEDRDRDRS